MTKLQVSSFRRSFLLLLTTLLFSAVSAQAQFLVQDVEEEQVEVQKVFIPYAFYTDSFGFGIGMGGGRSNFLQEQSSIFGALTVGTAEAYNISVIINYLRVPYTKRLYVTPVFMAGLYQNQLIYAGQNNPGFEGERAGSNESSQDNYFEEATWDIWSEFRFKYVLPMGDAKENPVSHYILDGQMLVDGASGGHSWNPFVSGKTSLELTPGARTLTVDPDEDEIELSSVYLRAKLELDNRDYPANPSRGYDITLGYSQDFEDVEKIGNWNFVEGEYKQYAPLPPSRLFRQQVLAFSAYTAYAPSWETEAIDGVEQVTERPPYYEGPRLGGYYRMRGYNSNRFQDKAAIYYSGEYRVIPGWQPARNYQFMRLIGFDGWQFVFFGELGRVAPTWQIDELHSDMKWDAGGSLRLFFSSAVGRLDIAVGEEGSQFTIMYGQPF